MTSINKNPVLTLYGGVGKVTGANFLLEAEGKRILIDCGLVQGTEDADEINHSPFPYDPEKIDILFITHAHMDHIGRVAKLVKDGFRGIIYSTPVTRTISGLMIADALKVMEYKKRDDGVAPMYEEIDVEETFKLWQTIGYHETKEIVPGVTVFVKDAGHILGSAMYEFTIGGLPTPGFRQASKKIVFTGDLGNSPSPLLRDAEIVDDADYLLMESVYGDRNHETRIDAEARLKQVLLETIEKGGTLVVPVFSLERTQEILYILNELVESKAVPSVPVFLDSPLAIKVTHIYEEVTKNFKDSIQKDISGGDNIFRFPKLVRTATSRDSHEISKTMGPKVVLAGSGMSTGGRVLSHEIEYLPDPKNTILLAGYQSLGTLGRELEEGAHSVMIEDQKVAVRAHVEKIEGFSSHMDSDHLVEFVSHTAEKVKQVFVAMGEPRSSLFLAQRLRDEFDVNALYPEAGKAYELK
jgi:metallo-beta-lactamase family protein